MYLLSASISCMIIQLLSFIKSTMRKWWYYGDIGDIIIVILLLEEIWYYSWRKKNWHYHRGNFANNDANLRLTAYWCQDISRYSLSNPKSFRSFDTNTMYRSNKFDTKKCCNIFCVISRTEINKGFLRRLQIYKEIVNATVTEIAPAAIIASSKTRFVCSSCTMVDDRWNKIKTYFKSRVFRLAKE